MMRRTELVGGLLAELLANHLKVLTFLLVASQFAPDVLTSTIIRALRRRVRGRLGLIASTPLTLIVRN